MKPAINVTPLIDVLLVLLIIFMIISPAKPSSFNAKIPQPPADDKTVRPNPDTLVVSLGSDMSVRLNLEPSKATIDDPAAIVDRLRDVFRQRDENYGSINADGTRARTVFIKAPKATGYGNVVRVIDAVKSAGADPISLQIDAIE